MRARNALSAVQNFLLGARTDGPGGTASRSNPPYLLKFRSSTLFISSTVYLAVFTDVLFYGLIVPVIPFSLTAQVGVPPDQVQQRTAILLACYNVALFIGSPLIGIFADYTSSRRLPFLLGLLALAGSTLFLCLGRTITLLIAGRLLQGLSAAIVWSVGLALLADTMGRNIGAAMGWVSIAMSTGLLIAPVIGGAVYAAAGYYAVYYVAFGVIFCDIVMRLALVEKKVARRWIRDDNGVLAARDVAAASGDHGMGNDSSTIDKAVAPQVAGSGDVVREGGTVGGKASEVPGTDSTPHRPPESPDQRRTAPTRHPTLVLITSPRILAALFGCVIEAGAMFAFDTVLPLFVKNTFHWNSTAAGLVFITVMIPAFLSPVVGSLSDRYGAKWLSLSGFVASMPLSVCLRFVTDNTLSAKVLLCALLVLLGSSLTLSNVPLMAEITYAIEDEEKRRPGIWGEKGVYGIAYGIFNTAFALGGAVGSIMAGYVMARAGWSTLTWSLAVWYAAAVPVVALWIGGKPAKPDPAEAQQVDVEAASAA